MQRFSARARTTAPRERVWALVADTASWAEWAPFDEAELESPGASDPEGLGAVRRFRRGRWRTRERVVEFEPPAHFASELVSGIPIRNYRADVTSAEADGGGTEILWESRYEGRFPLPARLIKRGLAAFVQQTADALADAAAR